MLRKMELVMIGRRLCQTLKTKGWNMRYLTLIIGLWMLIGMLVGCSGGNSSSELPKPETLVVGTEVSIRGTVIENNQGCAADADCFLSVETENGIFKVVYGEGRRIPTPDHVLCLANDAANAIGFSIVAGAEVEVFARVRDDGALATCYDQKYTIQVSSE
jgi:hypothetical protein